MQLPNQQLKMGWEKLQKMAVLFISSEILQWRKYLRYDEKIN